MNKIIIYPTGSSSATGNRYINILIPSLAVQITAAPATSTFPNNGKLSGLSLYLATNLSTSNDTITLYVNGSPTSLVCTTTALTTGAFIDSVHSVSVNAGDTGYLQLSTSATSIYTWNEMSIIYKV